MGSLNIFNRGYKYPYRKINEREYGRWELINVYNIIMATYIRCLSPLRISASHRSTGLGQMVDQSAAETRNKPRAGGPRFNNSYPTAPVSSEFYK